ncbi:MAG: hypothetical protein J6A75_09070 [Lachnospiraceae bacterium]|nr:hypothetical protein [Lachnospiraceae bacterium]
MKDKREIILKSYPFIFAFVLMCVYLIPKETMAGISGDAAEMWQVIKSYGTEDMYVSYVLYKGLLALYPYVWLYKLTLLLGVNEWLFVKIFYAFAFAYITTVGLPNLVEMLTEKKTVHYRKLFLALICAYIWLPSLALTEFMVDLPSFMYFLLLVNSVIGIYRYGIKWSRMLLTGIWLGFNLGGSGQYTAPAMCVMIFLLVVVWKQLCVNKNIKPLNLVANACVLLIPTFLLKTGNNYFLNVVVGEFRQAGAYIPSGLEWLEKGLSRFMNAYRVGMGVELPSNLNQAIYQIHLGYEGFAELQENILMGGYPMSISEYLKIVLSQPVNFIFCFLEKFFISLSPDGGWFRFLPLFIFYTCIYITLFIFVSRCKTIKQIFNVKFWLVFAFLWAIVPAIVMVVELRCVIQIQGLIMAVAICDECIWKKIEQLWKGIKNKKYKWSNIGESKIPYAFLLYCCFIIVCFLHMSSLYEAVGVDASIMTMSFK